MFFYLGLRENRYCFYPCMCYKGSPDDILLFVSFSVDTPACIFLFNCRLYYFTFELMKKMCHSLWPESS